VKNERCRSNGDETIVTLLIRRRRSVPPAVVIFFVIDKNIPDCLSFLPPSSAPLDLWTFVTL
jgi:hypothetical protein